MLNKENIMQALTNVIDPELQMSIVDLGLIYEVIIDNPKVKIRMTLTSMGCPLFDTIQDDIHHELKKIGIKEEDATIDLTFDPPWSMDNMSERAKAMLGI